MFKLQKGILSQFGSLSKNLKLLERDTWFILDVTEPYLHQHQNIELQVLENSKCVYVILS